MKGYTYGWTQRSLFYSRQVRIPIWDGNYRTRRRVVWIELQSGFPHQKGRRNPIIVLRSELKDGIMYQRHARWSKDNNDHTQSLQRIPRPIPTSYPPVRKNNLWDIKDEGGRISDTLLSQLRLDPARINREWLECSDLSPLANVDKCAKELSCTVRASQLFIWSWLRRTKVMDEQKKIWICSRHGLTTPSRLLSSRRYGRYRNMTMQECLLFLVSTTNLK